MGGSMAICLIESKVKANIKVRKIQRQSFDMAHSPNNDDYKVVENWKWVEA